MSHAELSSPAAPAEPDRRGLLGQVALGLGGLAAAAAGIPIVGYLLGPLLGRKPDPEIDLGPVKDYPENETRLKKLDKNPLQQPWDGASGKLAVYVRRLQGDEFQVFAVNCTHLGCPVSWFPQSGLFLCPCHGGVYYENGDRASGPPPHGLFRIPAEVRKDGHLWVRAGHLPTLQDPFEKSQRA